MIHFNCSKCGESMEAPESVRGEKQKCKTCGNMQKVTGDDLDLMKPLGNIEPICPYCKKSLQRKPMRRSQCPHCGNYFRVRTRPQDRQQALVTEEQAEEIAKQYYEGYGRDPEIWLREKCEIWNQKWEELNKKAHEYAQAGQWGLYRNCRYGVGEILRSESCFLWNNDKYSKNEKYRIRAKAHMKQAIMVYLEVVLFDLNGASNNEKFNPIQKRVQFWDIAPAVIDWIVDLSGNLKLQHDDIFQMFCKIAKMYIKYSFPLSTDEAWKRFNEALNEYNKLYTIKKVNDLLDN